MKYELLITDSQRALLMKWGLYKARTFTVRTSGDSIVFQVSERVRDQITSKIDLELKKTDEPFEVYELSKLKSQFLAAIILE